MVKTYQLGPMLLLLVLTITGKAWGVDDYFGPPISSEEIATAMANPSLKAPPPDGVDAIEHSGEFQGDIKITSAQQAQMRMGGRSAILVGTWQNGEIPYTISSVFTTSERQVIALAMAEYETRTCLKFVDRTTETDYISIISDSGCWSNVGRIGGQQYLSLRQNGCVYFGIAIHEFMHASGFWHEQSRYDRDKYVTINSENIQSGKEHNFAKRNKEDTTHLGLKYDYGSVMHYSAYAFSSNGNPTITSKPPGVTLGQRGGFSLLDVSGLNRLYNCKAVCSEAEGFFRVPESGNQCIKILGIHSRNWVDSNKACQDEGLQLAKPIDPIAMRKFILQKLGDGRYYWIGAKGTAAGVKWRDGTSLSSSNPAWYPGKPGSAETNSNWCVKLLTYEIDLQQQPHHPYYIQPCEWKANTFAMCELPAVCSEADGFFRVPESGNQCIKILGIHSRNWLDSNKACQDEGLQLAKPIDPIAMRKFILQKLGNGRYYWIGAKGTAAGVKWRDGTSLSSSNPAWYPGKPGSAETNSDWCVKLLTYEIDLQQQPNHPYYIQPCEWKANTFAMCEPPMFHHSARVTP